MKKLFMFFAVPIFCWTCTLRPITFINEFFYSVDSLKMSTLNFVSEDICIYTQEFFKDIPEEFKRVEIICKYWRIDEFIILENIKCPDYLQGLSCYSLPDSITQIYKPKQEVNYMGIPPRTEYDNRNYYGYINGIKNRDTLKVINSNIYYLKYTPCFDEGFNYYPSLEEFIQTGNKSYIGKVKPRDLYMNHYN